MSSDVNEAFDVFGVQITLWGEPASPSHNAERFKNLFEKDAEPGGPEAPFLTNPADCAVEAAALEPGAGNTNLAPITTALIDSWEQPEDRTRRVSRSFPIRTGPKPRRSHRG